MTPVLSIITVNYNGFQDTCALLDSIPFGMLPLEVIVVDNGSLTDEATALRNRYPHVVVLRSEQNLGFAGGNNIGIKEARGRYLLLINNDTILEGSDTEKQQGLQALINRLSSSESIGVVCPKLRFTWANRPLQYAGYTPLSSVTLRNRAIGYGEADHEQYDQPHPTPYAHGAAMMLKREAIEQAGLMPECYFLYYEELDWSMRIREAGYTIWYDPAMTVYHKESQTTGQDSPLKTYYITRNRLLFASRNISAPLRYASYAYLTAIVALRDILRYTFTLRLKNAKAVVSGIAHFVKPS